jgi:hypothetical protein
MYTLEEQTREFVKMSRERGLRFPLQTKDEFIQAMTVSSEPVHFRGQEYSAADVSRLIPDFFFPLTSEDDLIRKATELLMARGLLPVQPLDAQPSGEMAGGKS